MAKQDASAKAKVLRAFDFTGKARQEKNLQTRLGSMQSTLAKKEQNLTRQAESAKRELERIVKNTHAIYRAGQKPVANYANLQKLFDETLKGVTKEQLSAELAEQADAFIAKVEKARGEALTADQKTVVTLFYGDKARQSWNVIAQTEAVLRLDAEIHKVVKNAKAEKADKALEAIDIDNVAVEMAD